MSKFDRKKFREEQFKKSVELEVIDKYEDFQGTKTELLLMKTGDFILKHRINFIFGISILVLSVVLFVGIKEFLEYRINNATVEIEKVERKIAKNFNLTTQNKIQEYEKLLQQFSFKEAKLRIYKRLSDLHYESFDLVKASEYLEKSAELIEEPKELKAYYFYIAGTYRETSKDNVLALSDFTKASNFVTNNRETQSLTALCFYQAGRLKLLSGDKEAAQKDFNKVIDIESENPEVIEIKKLATFLLIKANKG